MKKLLKPSEQNPNSLPNINNIERSFNTTLQAPKMLDCEFKIFIFIWNCSIPAEAETGKSVGKYNQGLAKS